MVCKENNASSTGNSINSKGKVNLLHDTTRNQQLTIYTIGETLSKILRIVHKVFRRQRYRWEPSERRVECTNRQLPQIIRTLLLTRLLSPKTSLGQFRELQLSCRVFLNCEYNDNCVKTTFIKILITVTLSCLKTFLLKVLGKSLQH